MLMIMSFGCLCIYVYFECIYVARGKAATAVFNSDIAAKARLSVGDHRKVWSCLAKSGSIWARKIWSQNTTVVWWTSLMETWPCLQSGKSWPYLVSVCLSNSRQSAHSCSLNNDFTTFSCSVWVQAFRGDDVAFSMLKVRAGELYCLLVWKALVLTHLSLLVHTFNSLQETANTCAVCRSARDKDHKRQRSMGKRAHGQIYCLAKKTPPGFN